MFIKDGKTLHETNCTQEFAGTKDKYMSNKSRIPLIVMVTPKAFMKNWENMN